MTCRAQVKIPTPQLIKQFAEAHAEETGLDRTENKIVAYGDVDRTRGQCFFVALIVFACIGLAVLIGVSACMGVTL